MDLYTSQGIQKVFCTPHYRSPGYHVSAETARDALTLLENNLRNPGSANENSLELAMGAEVHLALDLADDLRADSIPTLGDTRYVLVEFPNDDLPSHSMRWLHELTVRGYTPIMAHPERHLLLRKDPKRVDELIEQGVLMQLTAMCFVTNHGTDASADARHRNTEVRRQSDQFAMEILSRGQATVIASDAHSTTRRPPLLAEAYAAIEDRFGGTVTQTLMANAFAIWNDDPTERVRPIGRPSKRWLPWKRSE